MNRIKVLFNQALELAPDARAAFLAAECGSDAGLRNEVESLLNSYNRVEAFLQTPATDFSAVALAAQVIESREASAVGKQVGVYRIVREIGHGGMGAVYLAVRTDGQFEQQVAIKILKRGLDTEQVLRRFHHERQILADLPHPNIARLLDGGMTDDGRPYFVMEYIAGQPLDDYAAAHQLSLEERLKLFCVVCAAVQYAHERRVIHRDLKPGNILITDEGTPKLLDFGIAKLLDTEQTAQSATLTPTAFRAMTPEYASPEQLRGVKLTPASDVYSLGVLLYELLTGRRPYRFASRLPHEIVRTLMEKELPRPSLVVGQEKKERTKKVEEERSSRQLSLSPTLPFSPAALRGDLDNIVLMALRKEPERRYASVEEFAADIRRHVNGLPVSARKDTLAYRTTKFLARHKAYAIITLTIALACLMTGLLLGGFASAKKPKESLAVLPFINASLDPKYDHLSEGVAASLIDSLSRREIRVVSANRAGAQASAVDPQVLGRALGVATVLTGRITSDGDKLTIHIELSDTSSNQPFWTKRYIGNASDVLSIQREALQDISLQLGLPFVEANRASLQKRYTTNAEAYNLYVKGQFFWNQRMALSLKTAEEYFQQAVERDPQFALGYCGIANSYFLLSVWGVIPRVEGFPKTKAAALKALEIDPHLAEAHTSLATVRWLYEWDWEAADQEFRLAIESNPRYATAHHWRALYLAEMGRFAESIASIERALEITPLSLPVNADKARVLFYARRYDESLAQYRKILEINPSYSAFYMELGQLYEELGMSEEWFSTVEKVHNSRFPEINSKGGAQAIVEYYRQDVARVERTPSANKNHLDLAKAYARLGEKDKAFVMLDRAIGIRNHQIAQLKVHPAFDPLRSDPRFAELLRRMKLTP